MPPDIPEDIARWVILTDEPEIRARQREVAQVLLEVFPELRSEWMLKPLLHQFERQLGRRIADDEQEVLKKRLARVGADRLSDVVLDLTPEALAAWLADSTAT